MLWGLSIPPQRLLLMLVIFMLQCKLNIYFLMVSLFLTQVTATLSLFAKLRFLEQKNNSCYNCIAWLLIVFYT